jgi:cyclopropane fatty-acyl-phospholipid synthase-like methyltransferase
MPRMDPADELRAMVTGFRLSAALSVAADLGLSDELADGPRTVPDLAASVSADEDSLRRLLHALSTVGVYEERDGDVFATTALGEGLRSDVPGSMRPLARTLADPPTWAAWGHLGHSVRTGDNAFQALHGTDVWTYRQAHPESNAVFNDNMTALSFHVAHAVAEAYDFSGLSTVVDVGGGQGSLLEEVLKHNEQLTGTVFDQAHVVTSARAQAMSASVSARFSVESGSFFEAVPPADAYLLKSILHDWPDDRCVQILRSCERSLAPGGVVLIVEIVLGRPGHEVDAAFSDLNMLVLPGGRERTEQQYAALFDDAGLRLSRTLDTTSRYSIVEARSARTQGA